MTEAMTMAARQRTAEISLTGGVMEGHFVTVRPGFAFIRPEGVDGNLYVSAAALAALPHVPRRGDPVRFRVAEMPDGRRRAVDLMLMEPRP